MAPNDSDAAKLLEVNSKTLGAAMPEITLQDGSKVQTGTVGALLINIKCYDALPDTATQQHKEDIEQRLRAALPLLIKVGMFDLFKPDEWTQGSDSPGRKFVGKIAKEYLQK